jgi:hypothetical protein
VFLEVFDQFTRGLQDRGLRPLLVNLSGGMAQEDAVLMLRRYSVDGVILASSTLPPTMPGKFIDGAGCPLVHCFGRWSPAPEVNIIGIDNVAAGRAGRADPDWIAAIAGSGLSGRARKRDLDPGSPGRISEGAWQAGPALTVTASFATRLFLRCRSGRDAAPAGRPAGRGLFLR